MKCPYCGKEPENCGVVDTLTDSQLGDVWQARAEKAETELAKLKNMSIINGDEIMDWLFENGTNAKDGAWHFNYHNLAEYINTKYQKGDLNDKSLF